MADQSPSPSCVQVLTTVGSEGEAERIGAELLKRRLAACVQTIGPMVSRYRWQGELERAHEWQLLAKTEAALYPEVEAAIRAVHSYEEPEILAIPVLAGSAGYLAWVSESVNQPPSEPGTGASLASDPCCRPRRLPRP